MMLVFSCTVLICVQYCCMLYTAVYHTVHHGFLVCRYNQLLSTAVGYAHNIGACRHRLRNKLPVSPTQPFHPPAPLALHLHLLVPVYVCVTIFVLLYKYISSENKFRYVVILYYSRSGVPVSGHRSACLCPFSTKHTLFIQATCRHATVFICTLTTSIGIPPCHTTANHVSVFQHHSGTRSERTDCHQGTGNCFVSAT